MDFYCSLEREEILNGKQTSKSRERAVKKQGDGRDFQNKKRNSRLIRNWIPPGSAGKRNNASGNTSKRTIFNRSFEWPIKAENWK